MGQVVAVYSDIASAYAEGARRPDFEAALTDLKAGRIDGIAVWKVDRLVRRVSQYRRVLDVLESSGARLFSLVEGIDTADPERKFVNGPILDLLVCLAEPKPHAGSSHTHRLLSGIAQCGRCLVPLRGGKNMESRSLLVETLSFEDVATEWAERPQEWRRAVLRLCTKSIVVEPVGKLAGVTAKGFRFDPERVRVKFAS